MELTYEEDFWRRLSTASLELGQGQENANQVWILKPESRGELTQSALVDPVARNIEGAINGVSLRLEGSSALLDKFLINKVTEDRTLLKIEFLANVEDFALWCMQFKLVVEGGRADFDAIQAMSSHHQAEGGKLAAGKSATAKMFHVVFCIIGIGIAAGR